MATPTEYYLRGIPSPAWTAAQARAALEGRTLKWVLIRAVELYAAGAWTPDASPAPPAPTHRPRRSR